MAASRSQSEHVDEDLPGTFAFVLIVAAVIIIVWLTVFLLFLSRY